MCVCAHVCVHVCERETGFTAQSCLNTLELESRLMGIRTCGMFTVTDRIEKETVMERIDIHCLKVV